jgi:aldehyde:ferredoxin oxidoreductase
MAKILRVNMKDRTATYQNFPDEYKTRGGRWLTSSLVSDEVDPLCHPLGPNNKVVLAPGIVTGTAAPTSARVSVGAKSPLTGAIKESNAGAAWAQDVARLGLKAIVIESQPEEKDKFWLLHITKNGVKFLPADEYLGKGLYEVYPQLFERFGKKVSIMGIGTAGEHKMAMAGVCFNDLSGRPSRYAGRGGMGAVLGSKGVKFIMVDDEGGPGVSINNMNLLNTGRDKLRDALNTHAISKPKGALNNYGTAVLINIMNEAGGLPTRNFSSGTFESAAKVAGEAIFKGNKKRLGKGLYNHACSPGCTIECSNTWYKRDGTEHVSCLEYESVWALGPNCGISSLDTIAEMVRLCNNYGFDTIEAGCTIGVAMEAGLTQFGNGRKAIQLLHEIGKGTQLGSILGNGAAVTGKVFGIVRVPVVKSQSMPAYDPRAVKGIGITYATTTMGADHTAGYTIIPEILHIGGKADPLKVRGKGNISRKFQAMTAFLDSAGHCLFIVFPILEIAAGYEGMVEECNGVLGTNWRVEDVTRIGLDILRMERKFNEAAGFTSAHDRLPEFMKYEPLPPHNNVFDVPDRILDKVCKF